MSTATKSSSASKAPVTVTGSGENKATTPTRELQNIQATYRLNGKNYLKWSQLACTFLMGRGKLSHLLGTGPKKVNPTFEAGDEEDQLVMELYASRNK